ncbi:MAG: ribosome maturation factor RimM [Granulosicoccus sp.]|nr:ribosome maturation factor RimM [Granulosicoccus sp.]
MEALRAEQVLKVELGRITGISGIKGWVKVHSDTRPRENIVGYSHWWLEQSGHWKELKVLDGRPQGKTIVAQLEGVSSPEQAGELIGAKIAVDRASMPETVEGEYYWTDLTGMLVRTRDSVDIGPVVRLFETGANDVMVVADKRTDPASNREILVPWVAPDVIVRVDMEDRVIIIDWDPDF